jgi:imidazole glycerol phosphate synthase subunit HisF
MGVHQFWEFDSVPVLVPVGERNGTTFPAGTRAAIVDLGPGEALVEIVEQDGTAHGPYDLSLTDLRLIEHARAA